MKAKLILPSLVECDSPSFRPVKYSLFPPLGLATLAGYFGPEDDVELVDEHVMPLHSDDTPDLVGIEVYITNAKRAYRLADAYRARGVRVVLGGLHVTALPEEAAPHADHLFLGPAEESFPRFLRDLAAGRPETRYVSRVRSLERLPLPRRDLIRRELYLVPNSLVVSRGCPHHCDFCYKDAFFEGGRSYYVQRVDDALREVERLPGRHLYFLDDHLLGSPPFAEALFSGMRGMRRLFQGASTVDAVLRGDTIERAVEAGLRSLFLGFETLDGAALLGANKTPNLGRDYDRAVRRLDDLGVMVNGSFVFGLDGHGPDVFARTVDWAVSRGLTTATFHIATPYPGTRFFQRIEAEGRLLTRDWDRYDTRQPVFAPQGMSVAELQAGYSQAYGSFYELGNILRGARAHGSLGRSMKHLAYSVAWKRLEPVWDAVIRARRLRSMRPLLEAVLGTVGVLAERAELEDTALPAPSTRRQRTRPAMERAGSLVALADGDCTAVVSA